MRFAGATVEVDGVPLEAQPAISVTGGRFAGTVCRTTPLGVRRMAVDSSGEAHLAQAMLCFVPPAQRAAAADYLEEQSSFPDSWSMLVTFDKPLLEPARAQQLTQRVELKWEDEEILYTARQAV